MTDPRDRDRDRDDDEPGPDADRLDADNPVEEDTIETLDPENPPA
jgi:hypothetical protein